MPSERFIQVAALLCIACTGFGCASTSRDSLSGNLTRCADITPEQWQVDSLSCGEGECERCYKLDLSEAQLLRLDVFVASGHPPFRVAVRDSEGREIDSADTQRSRPPTLLRANLAPGHYELRVEALGLDDPAFTFDLLAKLEPSTGPARTAAEIPPIAKTYPIDIPVRKMPDRPKDVPSTRVVSPAESNYDEDEAYSEPAVAPDVYPIIEPVPEPVTEPVPEPVPEPYAVPDEPDVQEVAELEPLPPLPPPPPSGLDAVVVDVETAPDGTLLRLLIGVGLAQGITLGAPGEIVVDGEVVGEVEIVESLQSGSWAQVRAGAGATADEILESGVVRIDTVP